MVQSLRRPSADAAPDVGSGRCLRGDDPHVPVHPRYPRQLRLNGPTHERWPPEAQGLPHRARWFRRTDRGIAEHPEPAVSGVHKTRDAARTDDLAPRPRTWALLRHPRRVRMRHDLIVT